MGLKSKIGLAVLIIVFLGIGAFLFLIIITPTHVFYTEDISDYNQEGYLLSKVIFPEAIPDNAQVVSFAYYDYWYELQDCYLELKFETVEDMELYLSERIEASSSVLENTSSTEPYYVEVQNPYNASFSEYIYLNNITFKGDLSYTGYEIDKLEEDFYYSCNFGIISFSHETLTVIHTKTCGGFLIGDDRYVPKYFKRFQVPHDQESQRLFYHADYRNAET